MEDLAVDTMQDDRISDTNGWTAPAGPPMSVVTPIDQSALTLPATPAKPSASIGHAAPPASSPLSYLDAPTAVSRREPRRRGPGRALAFLLVAAGLGVAGAVYGPGLYDEYVAEDDTIVGPTAPLAFPTVSSTTAGIRTATFELDGLPSGSDAVYTITVDFETWVSRVVIDRPGDNPDLEVLTFSEDALVRRLDSETWFQLDRGAFPFDAQLQRTDWIRSIDDLLPPAQRSGVEITEATEAVVGGLATRHLVLQTDPGILGRIGRAADPASTPIETPSVDPEIDPIGDIKNAVEVPVGEPSTSTPASTTVAGDGDATTSADTSLTVELWVDDDGLVRRSRGGAVLGMLDVTILDTTPDAWIPEYPDVSQVSPMTAGALIELGL